MASENTLPSETPVDPNPGPLATAGTLTLAKACQSVFVGLSGVPTTVTIPCVVTSTGNGESVIAPAPGSPYNVLLKVVKSGTTTPVYTNAGNTTGNYSLSGAGTQTSNTIPVKVVIPQNIFGTFTVTGSTAVNFTNGPAPATGDTAFTVPDDTKLESKIVVTVLEPIHGVKKNHAHVTNILVENNSAYDATLDVTANGQGHQQGLTIPAGGKRPVNAHSVTAQGSVGDSAEFVFKLKGTHGAAQVEFSVGSAYYIIP